MSLGMKSKAAIETELQTCMDSAERYFRQELDLKRFNDQLSHIITEKVEDYYYQRFRDWSVPDLLQLKVCIIERLKAEKAASK
jgi:hypothetical protein